MPLLARSQAAAPNAFTTATPPHILQAGPQHPIPSIRLISATPSATGLSSEASTSYSRSLEDSWATMPSIPSPLAPKPDEQTRKKLVPKKSKLSILGAAMGRDKDKERAKDFSDVVRRVGASQSATGSGGFEIYVDPTIDPDIGEIVMVKKKKSRAALDGMAWGPLGEVTNVPKTEMAVPKLKEAPGLLKVKNEEEKKWWSIGRGRKDSKEKTKENKASVNAPVEFIYKPDPPAPRSKTPEPFKSSQDSRGRFNSLDSGLLLGGKPKNTAQAPPRAQTPTFQLSEPEYDAKPTSKPTIVPMPTQTRPGYTRSASTSAAGLLAPPTQPTTAGTAENGSIAIRAMRSMRSLARMGSWAQLKSMPTPTAQEMAEEMERHNEEEKKGKKEKEKTKKDGTVKEKKKGTVKEKKTKKENKPVEEEATGISKKKKSVKKDKSSKSQTLRVSTSSFEVGALTASPEAPKTLGSKKRSILGLGLPSTMRLPSMRGGSTASSINFNALASNAQSHPVTTASVSANPNAIATVSLGTQPNRLSVDSAIALGPGRDRAGSVASSAGSSLRPISMASTNSGASSGSSGASVRWDEEGLQTVREQRRKEREVMGSSDRRGAVVSEDGELERVEFKTDSRRTSRESRRSSEGRKRTPLSAVFPEVQHHQIGAAMLVEEEEEAEEEDDERRKSASSIDARSLISNSTSSSMRMGGRRTSYGYPILTIEEATSDGHGRMDYDEPLDEDEHVSEDGTGNLEGGDEEEKPAATPVKKARKRPMSEQMLGRMRPKPMHAEDDEAFISIIQAATNDLALLINNLDLQATPGTPDMTPLRPSDTSMSLTSSAAASASASPSASPSPKHKNAVADSPLKKTLRKNVSSISSLRPYAQSRGYVAKSSISPKATMNVATATTAPLRLKPSVVKSNADLIGQQIAPWHTLIQGLSPVKEKANVASISKATPPSSSQTFKPGHKRTMTPAPEPEPEPVFQPLKPARSRVPIALGPAAAAAAATIRGARSIAGLKVDVQRKGEEPSDRLNSSNTFGPRSSSRASRGSMTLDELASSVGGGGSLTPVFKRIQDTEKDSDRKRSSLVPSSRYSTSKQSTRSSRSSHSSYGNPLSDSYADSTFSVPIARERRRELGMSGTMGGSDVSCYNGPEPDASDPDSDVPDELRVILATHSNRNSVAESLKFRDEDEPMSVPPQLALPSLPLEKLVEPKAPSPRVSNFPPMLELPIFRASLVDDDDNHLDIDDGSSPSDEDTKKSFDFTGELKKLNESGASDRHSFVEQLENAFRTPAKVDLRSDFGVHLRVEVPPVPALPLNLRMAVDAESSGSSSSVFDSFGSVEMQSRLVDVMQPSMLEKTQEDTRMHESKSKSNFDMFSASRIVDMKEPTLLQGTDSLTSSDEGHDMMFERAEISSSVELGRSTASKASDGQLNTSFKFGGLPKNPSTTSLSQEAPLTLSDIIPPPEHARSLSEGSMMLDDLEDDSVLKSIYAKLLNKDAPAPRPRVNSDSSMHLDNRRSIYKARSRPTSGISFAGLESFDEVRRGFEFSADRPAFYPPPAQANASRRAPHRRHESVFSIASVSSYGHVLNHGSSDPFDYGLPSLRERPSSEDVSSISMSMTVDDTFDFIHNQPRRRVESDASSYYFRAPNPAPGTRAGHRRRESNMSTSSIAPPISLYNRSYGHHRRNDSTASSSSVAISYAKHGANSGINAWARHRKDQSMDSVMSDFSGMHIGRPGVGDKMFDTAADNGPLTSITASPPESASASQSRFDHRNSYDSIMDDDRRASMNDSLFEETGQRHSASDDSVFGDDYSHSYPTGLLPPNQFRPLSILSMRSDHSPMKEDDTMISMLGGGHVRRRSVGSIIEASPCVRVEKRKHSAVHEIKMFKNVEQYESPNKARIVEKASIASTSSFQFGGERMIKAQHGLLERQSLEDSCLIADGEELASAFRSAPVFTRPGPAARSRSSTCTSSSSGGDTPPLSAEDGSSFSEGSQSSIDLSHINFALSNATHPLSTVTRNRVRTRARGAGHRRRYSKAHMSRSSVYETIEEEMLNVASPVPSTLSKMSDPTTRQGVYIVDSDASSTHSGSEEVVWDDERGIVALRKFYALRDEAHVTVTESRRVWSDTPFSVFAVQSFHPPSQPASMQALLQHSVQNYGPLPSDLRPRRTRSRTSSRPSPYPQNRITKASVTLEETKTPKIEIQIPSATPVLRQVLVNPNVLGTAPSLEVLKPFSPLVVDMDPKRENAFGLAPNVRPRVGSSARRTALGWSKRSNGKVSTDQKENAVGNGSIMTPGDGLRLNRPRPKGRPTPGGRTPASQHRPIRI